MHVNLGMSLRKTKYALKELYNINISHQQVANYCKTAAVCIKPFIDHYDYNAGKVYTADETYIKIRGIKAFVWFIMDAASRSIIGYRISSERDVGSVYPCHAYGIPASQKASGKLPLYCRWVQCICFAAAQQFLREYGTVFKFNIT